MEHTGTFLTMFAVFAAILVGAGIYSKRWVRESADFILAGREVSTLINTMGVCAIGFAGTTVALAPGLTVAMGLVGGLSWGLIHCLGGHFMFGVLYSNFIRRCGAQTLPEYLEMRFSSKVRSTVSIASIIGMAGILANNIVSCAQVIVGYTNWNPTLIISVIFIIILAFTLISGLWAATITDFFQVCIGVVAVPTLLTLLFQRYGGISALSEAWPMGSMWNTGITGAHMPTMALTYPSILNLFVCFAAALLWGNNYYWMKIASCRNEKVARRSFMLAGLILAVVFMIPLAIVGLYAGSFFTENFTLVGGTMPHTSAYGIIVKIFSPLLGSFFVIAAVAASISTASTSALGASAVATRDIYQRLINPGAGQKTMLRASKMSMFLIGIFTWIMCQVPGGPIYLFAFASCWLIPPAILLVLGALWPRFNAQGALWGAGTGMVIMVVFTLLGDVLGVFQINNYVYLASLGFTVTLVVAVVATFWGQSRYYGTKGWQRIPNDTNRIPVSLEPFDIDMLKMIRLGHLYMADLTDASGVDSKQSGASIDKLDQGGYIVRAGIRGSAFYTFSLTEKGQKALPPLSGIEKDMADNHLTPMYVELLDIVMNNPQHQAEFLSRHQIKSMHMASISSHLTRRGYIEERGVFKRKLHITEKGKDAVRKYGRTGENNGNM